MTDNPKRANIILFGESGVGKSSLVNMIAGRDCAKTSDDATGCTFASIPYNVDLPGHRLRIWDTAGLNQGAQARTDFKTAVGNIYTLTRKLEGVNLLVYCIRPSRITDNMVRNYNMFRAFCSGKVDIVLVITAMENSLDEGAWWTKNVAAYERAGIKVLDHACVSTLRLEGKDEDYGAWRTKVQDMITTRYLRAPWVVEKDGWLVLAVTKLIEVTFDGPSNRSRQLYEGLRTIGHSKKNAREAARKYDASCHQGAKRGRSAPLVCRDEPAKLTMSLSRSS
ncbi:P-loop containing nucleoside triphosphate hydrolase protein [Athelia psychrophila]|uniref:P-loop containing nucleoside triphosphate hydrolase protein n=1 Tax=Athelia psychrophila TaxID=1759441 RepID=A0A166BS34_9AGAM|nr:P-loop containing nucleoside triphosphate hydrolase protein [Fibularhizoctonia sp. CBS 109695]